MRHLRTLATLVATAAVGLTTAPAALAKTATVGNANGNPTMNICVASIDCTYINYKHGKATDVVRRNGLVTSWSLNAGSVGGQVQLRILRRAGGGSYVVVRTSAMRTVSAIGLNTFPAHIKVRAGDVLALGNASSGIYMTQADPGVCVRYFSAMQMTGAKGTPTQISPQLHVLLSARVKS